MAERQKLFDERREQEKELRALQRKKALIQYVSRPLLFSSACFVRMLVFFFFFEHAKPSHFRQKQRKNTINYCVTLFKRRQSQRFSLRRQNIRCARSNCSRRPKRPSMVRFFCLLPLFIVVFPIYSFFS